MLRINVASKRVAGALMVGTALGTLFSALPAIAQGAPLGSTSGTVEKQFNIPPQSLQNALTLFAQQAGIQVSVNSASIRSAKTSGISGRFSAQAAIERLLADAGQGFPLTYRYVNARTIVVSDDAASAAAFAGSIADGSTALDTIVVRGHGFGRFRGDKAASYDNAQSTFVLDNEEIDRFRGSSPADILKGIPGVTAGDVRNGGSIDPNIRGMQGQDRVKVTVDGTESTFDAHRGYAGRQQRHYIDPDLISGLTVVKGPQVSGGAIGGSIEMITLRPEDVLVEGNEIGVRIKGGVASNSTSPGSALEAELNDDVNTIFQPRSRYGNIAFAAGQENFEIVAAYARRNNGNYFSGKHGRDQYRVYDGFREENTVGKFYPERSEVLNSSTRMESALFKTTLRPGDDHALELSYRWSDGYQGEIMPSNIIRNSTGYIPQWEPSHFNSDNVSARYKWDPADSDLINLSANLGYSLLYYDGYSSTFNFSPSDKPSCDGDYDSEKCYRQFYGLKRNIAKYNADIRNISEFDTTLGSVNVTIGGGLNFDRMFPPAHAPSIENGTQLSGGRHQEGDRFQTNAFGNIEWEPADDLTFNLGGRFTGYKTRDRYSRHEDSYVDELFRPVTFTREWIEVLQDFDDEGNEISVPVAKSESGVAYWTADANGNFTSASDPRLNRQAAVIVTEGNKREEFLADFKAAKASVGPNSTRRVKKNVDMGRLSRRGSNVSPTFNGSYEFIDGWKIHGAYTHGIRMPGLIESISGTSSTYVRDGLLPEEARNLEVALSTRAQNLLTGGDTFMAKLTYFDNKTKNYITRHGLLMGELDVYSQTFYNADQFRAKGLEFQSAYDSGDVFASLSVTRNLSAITCDAQVAAMNMYQMQDRIPDCVDGGFSGSFVNAQNPPEYTINTTLGARFLDESLTLATRATYTSGPTADLDKIEHTASGNAGQLFYRPVTLVDVFASYDIDKNARFDLSAENIFDRYYLDPLSLSTMPGPGRTLKASLTVKF